MEELLPVPEDALNDFPNIARAAMRIKTSMNAHEFPPDGETNYQPSLTIPDQAMSVREILDRYSRGIPFDNYKTPIYEGEDSEFADLAHMDLADREAYILEKEAELRDIKARVKQWDDETKTAHIAKLREEEREKIIKELSEQGLINPKKDTSS